MIKPMVGSIAAQLNELGITVTRYNDPKYPKNTVVYRMLLEKDGTEIGYLSPNEIRVKYNIKVY